MRPVNPGAVPASYANDAAVALTAINAAMADRPQRLALEKDVEAFKRYRRQFPGTLRAKRPAPSNSTTLADLLDDLRNARQAFVAQAGDPALYYADPATAAATDTTIRNQIAALDQQARRARLTLLLGYLDLADRVRAKYTTAEQPGWNKIKATYPTARGAMIARIGHYCSYCELPIVANLAIEHIAPKAAFPTLAVEWSNFLLACSACNSRKGDEPDYVAQAGETPAAGAARLRATFISPSDAAYDFNVDFVYELRHFNEVTGANAPMSLAEAYDTAKTRQFRFHYRYGSLYLSQERPAQPTPVTAQVRNDVSDFATAGVNGPAPPRLRFLNMPGEYQLVVPMGADGAAVKREDACFNVIVGLPLAVGATP